MFQKKEREDKNRIKNLEGVHDENLNRGGGREEQKRDTSAKKTIRERFSNKK